MLDDFSACFVVEPTEIAVSWW